jgi:hypothetical protein
MGKMKDLKNFFSLKIQKMSNWVIVTISRMIVSDKNRAVIFILYAEFQFGTPEFTTVGQYTL